MHERVIEMATSKVKVTVGGVEYSLVTDDGEEYLTNLAAITDKKFQKLMKENPGLSLTQCAVLVSLALAEDADKANKTADKFRLQIKDYLDDASNAKSKADWARHELEEANKLIAKLKKENSQLKEKLKKQAEG